jgi:hypothetical protein
MVELQIEQSLELLTPVAPLHLSLLGLRGRARTNGYQHRLDNEGIGPSFVDRLRTGPDVIDSATALLKPTAIVNHVNARRVIIACFGFFIQTRIDAVDAPGPMQDWRLSEIDLPLQHQARGAGVAVGTQRRAAAYMREFVLSLAFKVFRFPSGQSAGREIAYSNSIAGQDDRTKDATVTNRMIMLLYIWLILYDAVSARQAHHPSETLFRWAVAATSY